MPVGESFVTVNSPALEKAHKLVIFPDFSDFEASHVWVGAKLGDPQIIHRGWRQKYVNATVYVHWGTNKTPFEVHGPLENKYDALKGTAGFLGFPTSDETPVASGHVSQFEGGQIFQKEGVGAFEVHGAILQKYLSLGGPGGFLGFPTTDESTTPDQVGRYNHFEGGSIYWTPQTGAFEVHGAIRDRWSELGWEQGFLGYPVSDEHDDAGVRVSDFQNGSIRWTANAGAVVQPQWIALDAPHITFGGGVPVGGWGRFTIFSDGTTHYQGHLHVSGWPSYDIIAVFTIVGQDGKAYTATATGHLHGTNQPGSRDVNWDEWGHDDAIKSSWASLRSWHQTRYSVKADSDWSMKAITDTVKDIVGAIGTALEVIGVIFGGGAPDQTKDPESGLPTYGGTSEAGGPGDFPPPDAGLGVA